jgi:hypothetical protein
MRPMGSKLASRGLDSRQPVTEEIRFRIQARPCKISGGQSVTETGFSRVTVCPAVSVALLVCHINFLVNRITSRVAW